LIKLYNDPYKAIVGGKHPEALGQPASVVWQEVYVDHEMWEKIVLNLLSNAFKYTLEGEITVQLVPSAISVELCMRDTGVGIPAEELPHLFERFHRVKGTAGRTYEGTGIGLALVHELVRLHGGNSQCHQYSCLWKYIYRLTSARNGSSAS